MTRLVDEAGLNAYHWRVIALCADMVFVDGFDLMSIGYAAPAMTKSLAISRTGLGVIFSAGQLGLALGALIFGLAGDRWGRKRVFIGCGLGFGLASFAITLFHTYPMLVLLRVTGGLCLGGATPIAITITTDYCPRRVRAGLTMLMYSGMTIGGVASGAVYAATAARGWQPVFYVGGIAPLLLAPVLMLYLPESLNYLVSRQDRGAEIGRILARVHAGYLPEPAAEYFMAEAYDQRIQVPTLFAQGYAVRTTLLWMVFFMGLISAFGLANWLPSLLNMLGISASNIVVMSAVGQVGGLVGTVSVARLIVLYPAFLVAGAAYLLSALFSSLFGYASAWFPLLLALSFCHIFVVNGAQNIMNAMAAELYPPRMRATGVGWGIGIGRLGAWWARRSAACC